jgi:6-phosphogluconate dehydrogenase
MQLGMIGLGRMGANLVLRLAKHGHRCVVYDVDPAAAKKIAGRRIRGCASVAELVAKLARPRAVWVMLPAGVAGSAIEELASHLEGGDIIIDGGNTWYRDDLQRAKVLRRRGIHYVDCGTSGGVFGRERGYCLMIGGEGPVVGHLEPIFRSLAPGVGAAPRTAGRKGHPDPAERGYLHCGPSGAGHFVKMVHNGIEYGLMAAYAEGLNILRNANAGKRSRESNAGTAALRNPEHYQYDLDLPRIAELWRRGSVIGSWLLDLTAASLLDDPGLKHYAGRVSDSGEGRWTIEAAIDQSVPVPVLSAALYERFSSQGGADFANRVLSAMRKQFGGHDESKRRGRSRNA